MPQRHEMAPQGRAERQPPRDFTRPILQPRDDRIDHPGGASRHLLNRFEPFLNRVRNKTSVPLRCGFGFRKWRCAQWLHPTSSGAGPAPIRSPK
jgi:hypothetical protein